ncbi:MAG TPA: tetratricopeptide repeat protein [Thermoanaerobaculia bacterium]|nr:tetratricopeptide repeat protein [Thermoanaerobaculia bacterium]
MSLEIRLLGAPRIEHDREASSGPRGHKAWALLAYLLLCRQPPSRRRLAELLFCEADDPLGALRWSLAQLRQALGQPNSLRGDPVELSLEPGTEVDLFLLRSANLPEADEIDRFTGELLEGMSFSASPAFEAWLAIERRHHAAAAEGLLLERAQAELGAGRPTVAASLATRLLELNPLEESHHEILVRSLVAAGDSNSALARAQACEELLKRELGAPPLSRLREIVRAAERPAPATAVAGAAAARAQLEMGRAAIGAGAVDAGLDSLRRACAAAEGCRDDYLHARAELALGSALIHAMRAYGEAAIALHRAVGLARRIGANAIAATAHRELGFVDVQAGRNDRVEPWLTQATEEAAGSDEELTSIAGVRGMGLSDSARYEEALEAFEESVERARRCGHRRQVAWSLSLIGRVHLLTGSHAQAREVLDRSLELVEEEKWIAFEPLPESLLAHVDLRENRAEEAREGLEHSFTIACQVADPCWEAIACRGLGLVEAASGREPRALAWMLDARTRCTRVAHPYQWIQGWVLDGLCAVGHHDKRAADWIDELESLASRTGLRELLLRAYLHRARRGDPSAPDAARLLGDEIDNPTVWSKEPT